jgi:hypothetical protein
MNKLFLLLSMCALALAGCVTEWGSKMRTTSEVYPRVRAERVEILFARPTRAYKQIGIVSVTGSSFSSDIAMLKKLRKAAADLGADAVIVVSQFQGLVSVPPKSTTVGTVSTTGANTTTLGTSGETFAYPKTFGIAIKYNAT